MIFKPELAERILKGEKTQTRRLIKDGEYLTTRRMDALLAVRNKMGRAFGLQGPLNKWVVGHTYAIQPGRGKKAIGRFRLLNIRCEFLQDISGEDAQAEGVSHTAHNPPTQPCPSCAQAAFPELWDSINKPGTRWEDNPEVWVLEFEVV